MFILFFNFFSTSRSVFQTNCQKFLGTLLALVIEDTCDQDVAHSLDTSKISSVEFVPQMLFTTRVKHDTAYLW